MKVSEPALFLTGFGEAFAPNSMGNLVAKIIENSGVLGAGGCHRFRHACATHMLQGGADRLVIMQMLGHSSVATTAIYAAVDVNLLKAVHKKTHPASRVEKPDEMS